jgi:hypothetical protein
VTGWEGTLDALAAHLAEQRAALADGRPEDLRAFTPPAAPGPVPPALAERLRALGAESDALSAALATACAAVARQLQLVSVLHAPRPTSASFVDTRG